MILVCCECGRMFDQQDHSTWKRNFCPDCLKQIHEEDRRDGERDERGNDEQEY